MTVLRTAYVEVMPKTDRFEPELNKRIRRIDASAAAGAAGDQAGESFGKRMSTALATAFAAAGIGAMIGGSITAALDVSGANDKLRAQLALTKDESGRLGKAAGELYASNYGDSMGTVNDAIAKVIQAVPSLRNASVPVLKEIAGGALDIARVFDQDVAKVTSAVSSMLRSGLAPNAQAAMDIITKGLQSGADKGGDFLDTLTEYSVQFTKLGLDGPASLGVINQLLAGGARNSDLAADALKEFSLRAIDGSKTSVEGYKLLNLNAKEMQKTIAAGGPAARQAFGTVVEQLNAMQDPVKRNTAGVALFGTQWEDLGDSFRRLDVSSVTDGLGKVAGATKGIADQSDQGRIQSFVRTLQTGLVSVVGGELLPRLTEWGTKLSSNQDLMDGLRDAGDRLVTVLQSTGEVTGTVVGWFREHETVTKSLAVAVGALLVVTQAHAAVMAVQAAGGIVQYIASIRIVSAVTKAWTAVQWLINVALTANPIGLVVAALVALGVGLFVAYKKSETFRNIVQGAWKGIQTAISFAWNNVIKPVVNALVWYFQNVVTPYVMFLWNNVFKPAWAGISYAVKAAWVVIQIALAAFKLYLNNVIIPVIKFLYNNVVKPVFNAIGTAVSWTWNTLIKPAFNNIKTGFSLIGSLISSVWNNYIKPVLTVLGTTVRDKVASAFTAGVNAIKTAWNKLKETAAAPVRFLVNTVINKGVIGGINWVAEKVGVKDRIAPIKLGFNQGGQLPGPPSAVDNMVASSPLGPVALAGGEYIVNARQTARHLPLLEAINAGRAFADGGLLGLIKGPAKWLSDRLGLGRLTAQFGDNPMVKTVLGAGKRVKDLALGRLKALVSEFLAGPGGAGEGGLQPAISGALAALRATFGRVPLISGLRPGAVTLTGNTSYHASGRAFDIAPVRDWAEFLRETMRPKLRELITPWQDLNLLNGRPHQYRGAVWRQHNFAGGNAHIHTAMANGGVIREPVWGVGRSGRTYSFGEVGPERVTPGEGRLGGEVHLHFHGPVASKQAAQDMVLGAYQQLRRERKIP
ncbi:phage tail tape measure protein [Micromonospora sp. NPDC001898]|uniref:phage tail tape measure protein n=1 Tax=Micromonospora sp. NPDC001898 TaxID=3364221 RepID=UPI00369CD147